MFFCLVQFGTQSIFFYTLFKYHQASKGSTGIRDAEDTAKFPSAKSNADSSRGGDGASAAYEGNTGGAYLGSYCAD
jgi:hypothetical protein